MLVHPILDQKRNITDKQIGTAQIWSQEQQQCRTLEAGADHEGSRGVGAAEDQYSRRTTARCLVEEGGGVAQHGVVGGVIVG